MRSPAHRFGRTRRALATGVVALCAIAPGCNLLSKTASFPSRVFGGGKKGEDPAAAARRVQAGVMRFVDTFNARMALATNQFAEQVGTPEARIQALTWRVIYMTAALTVATGTNPNANMLDMLTLVSLGKIVHEDYWMPEVWGESDQAIVDAFTALESEVWEIAEQSFPQNQLEEVRETIREWREQHPGKEMTAFVRLPSYRNLLAGAPAKKKHNDVFQSVADLLSLDPFEGLEPATREAAELRALGERAFFYAQRAPLVFQAQAELLTMRTARLPEAQKLVEQGDRLSLAAKTISETAKDLPERLSDELTEQREGILRDLENVREPATELLAQARTTIDAGKEMSMEVRGAISTLDTFVARVSKDERSAPDAETPSRPFDVREYGDAAARVAEAARELDQLLVRVDEKLPHVQAAVAEVAETSDQHVDRWVRRALLAGLVLIAVGSVASLGVRWIAARWKSPSAHGARS